MAFSPSELIYAKRVPGKGLGVFARVDIERDQLIEEAPVIVLPADEARLAPNGGVLGRYAFTWGRGQVAIALGFGSLYNHARYPNAICEDRAPRMKRFLARRRIHAGEEITIHYGGAPGERSELDFDIK